ncbi:hypothetical protein ACT453_24200, partial [Bacillus sp. D-CC]
MKALKISLTVVVELALIYLFSLLVGWSFMEAFFLGSLAIFGAIWLIALNINQNNNIDHTIYKTESCKTSSTCCVRTPCHLKRFYRTCFI